MSARRGPPPAQESERASESGIVIGQPFEIPGFPGYRMQPFTDLEDVVDSYSEMRTDLTNDPWDRCSERAHVWAYELNRRRSVSTGKVFLFYTNRSIGRNPSYRRWIWHVTPYVATLDGKLWAMERFAGVKTPIALKEWIRYQSAYSRDGEDCTELKGDEKEVYRYICGNLTPEGDCTKDIPDLIRVEGAGPKCFFRRVPQYYVYPRDVANHDYLGRPEIKDWDERLVYEVCRIPMSGPSTEAINEKCAEIIGGSDGDPAFVRPAGAELAGVSKF